MLNDMRAVYNIKLLFERAFQKILLKFGITRILI